MSEVSLQVIAIRHLFFYELRNPTMNIYVGTDISKLHFDSCIEGKVYRFDNNNSGHLNFIKHLPEGAWVVMECTGTYGHRLAETLVGHGFLVSIVNALQVKRFAQSRFKRAKTDKADAKILTEYAQSLEQCHDDRDRLRLWIPEKSSQIFLKQLRTVYEMLVQVRTMMSNQLEALEGYPMVIPMARQTLQSLLKTMNIKINAIEDAMNTIVDKNYPDESKNLESIPGIARKSAIVIIAAVGDIQRFTDAKAFAAFAGLAPRVIESGSSVRGRGILSHYGVTWLRSQLYMCAMSALRWNKQCKELYLRLVAKGKSKKSAILAVAHKLVRQIYAVLSYNTRFDSEYSITKKNA